MTTLIPTGPGSIRKSGGAVFAALALTGAIGFFAASPAEGKDPDEAGSLKTKAEIEALGICYAEAADTMGRGDVEEGRQIARTCFTEDAVWDGYSPLQDPSTPPAVSTVGPDGWADAVSAFFAAQGYAATQHQIGNIQITVHGNTATMKSYVTASHIVDWGSNIDVVMAVYIDHLVRTPHGWRIAHRTATGRSLSRLTGSPIPMP